MTTDRSTVEYDTLITGDASVTMGDAAVQTTDELYSANGGQAEATIPEIRLAVAEPELDVGNVETALEALSTTCYYLSAEKNRYRFSLSPNQDLHVVEWRGNEIGR